VFSADFSPQGRYRAKKALEFCGRLCAVLTFLRDKSRAPAAILAGALNTYSAPSTIRNEIKLSNSCEGLKGADSTGRAIRREK